MKETNVWMTPQELHHMLQGSLQWNDVADRVNTPKNGIRKLGQTMFEKQSALNHDVHPGK